MWLVSASLIAQTTLPEFPVVSSRVANQSSVGTIDTLVSGLRFEPRVDVQGRNLAEAQADIAIRGGIFESTGFRIGAAALGDAQTGHYQAELPVPPAMLEVPRVSTGLANAVLGLNATAGTVDYGWRRISPALELSAAGGNYGYNRQGAYAAGVRRFAAGEAAADIEWSRSEGDGSRPAGDHDFNRIAARLQWRGPASQTDLFAGYQSKFFGWPNLYTPFGFNETENLQTALAVLNHRWADGAGNEFSAAAFWRRNKDDYEFNRAVPGASNPFQHTIRQEGIALSGRKVGKFMALAYSADYSRDRLQSTALIFGRYSSRTLTKFTLVPELRRRWGGGEFTGKAGVAYDDSNRADSAWSPLLGAEWRGNGRTLYAEYSEATQLPSYTALNSNAAAGLFRGNSSLGRSNSRNIELGAKLSASGWEFEAAVFQRFDDNLVDWTFRRGVVARTANAVDIRNTGLELLAVRRTSRFEVVLGYAWLEKHGDYGSALVDASFYALNFPRHRITAAFTWRLGAGFEIRSDNEFRVQEDNPLRTAGGDSALHSSLGLYYAPSGLPGWQFSLLADNLWQSEFQEVPAVPSARRQWAVGVTRRW